MEEYKELVKPHSDILLLDVQGTLTDYFSTLYKALHNILGPQIFEKSGVKVSEVVVEWRKQSQQEIFTTAAYDSTGAWIPVLLRNATVLRRVLDQYHIPYTSQEIFAINQAWTRLEPWPDVIGGLAALSTHYIVVSLSNIDAATITALSRNWEMRWDAAYAAEHVGCFKPNPLSYQRVLDFLAAKPAQVTMVASHRWDLDAAAQLGMSTAFISRPLELGPDSDEYDKAHPGEYDYYATGLLSLAQQLIEEPSQYTPLY